MVSEDAVILGIHFSSQLDPGYFVNGPPRGGVPSGANRAEPCQAGFHVQGLC